MLLLHRLTPFAFAFLIALSLGTTSFYPLLAPWILPIMLVVCFFLCARLADFRWRDKAFWGLIAAPTLFLFGATLLFLLADRGSVRLLIVLATSFLAYFYAEHLFRFIHLPAVYQAHGLQNTGGVMSILTIFYLSASAYALMSFVRLPLLLLSSALFVWLAISAASALWIAHVPRERAFTFALAAAIMFTQLFVAVSFLPTSFMTSGALIAVLYYMFMGLSRAHVQAKLGRKVIRRYVGIGFCMLLALLITAQWI